MKQDSGSPGPGPGAGGGGGGTNRFWAKGKLVQVLLQPAGLPVAGGLEGSGEREKSESWSGEEMVQNVAACTK